MTIHTLHTPLKSGSNCFGHPTASMWMATCTHLAPTRLWKCYKHHNMQTLSAVSCQRSAVSCRSFCARVHAFGTSPALQNPHYLYVFSTTDTTTTTTTTTHPITMCHTHTIVHVPPLHTSDTRYVSDLLASTHDFSDLTSLFIRHMLHF